MAETVVIAGQPYKRRNVVAVWIGLPLVTLGVYAFVWIYKVNNEARRFLRDDSIRPAMSVLAFIPGFILIVPPYIAVYRLGKRIRRMQEAAGVPQRCEPWIGLILAFIASLYSLYYQSHLNSLWDAYLHPGMPSDPPVPVVPKPGEPGAVTPPGFGGAIPPAPSSSQPQ